MSILLLLLSQIFTFVGITNSDGPTNKSLSLELKKIDISSYKSLIDIMNEVISEKKDNDPCYYTIYFQKYNEGYRLYITENTSIELDSNDDYKGFFTIGSDSIIIRSDNDISFKYKDNKAKFKVIQRPPICYDPPEWNYYIEGAAYARNILGVGWIWNKPLEIKEVRNKNIYRV